MAFDIKAAVKDPNFSKGHLVIPPDSIKRLVDLQDLLDPTIANKIFRLTLKGNKNISRSFLPSLQKLHKLIHLDLSDANIHSPDLPHITNIGVDLALRPAKHSSLQTLILHNTQIGQPGLEEIAKNLDLTSLDLSLTGEYSNVGKLQPLTKLTELKLAKCSVLSLDTLSTLTTLTHLDLSAAEDLGHDELNHIAKLSLLESLKLSGLCIGSPVLKVINHLKSLKVLSLSFGQFEDSSLQNLLLMPRGYLPLEELDLSHNAKLTNYCSRYLKQIRSLKVLNLKGTGVKPLELSRDLPNCSIIV